MVDLTVGEESTQPSSLSVDRDGEMRNSNGEEISATGPLRASNAFSNSSSSHTEEDTEVVTRRVQPMRRAHLQREQQHDDESEKEESTEEAPSDEENCSKRTSNKEPQARPHRGRRRKHPVKVVTYSELEKKQPTMAKKVLDYYKDPRERASVHVCALSLDGKCKYMSKYSRGVFNHIQWHGDDNLSVVKIVDYPVPRDSRIHECTIKSYSDLKKDHPELAKRVLSLYNDRYKKLNRNVHLCGLCTGSKDKYISYSSSEVRGHMASKHPNQPTSIVKVVGYPGSKQKTFHDYVVMTHAELYEKDRKLARRALDMYYESNCKSRAHFCGLTISGECDYASVKGINVQGHIKHNHSRAKTPVAVYRIAKYPSKTI